MRIPALVLAASLALAGPAGAAPKPQLVDPVGDLLPVYAPGYDVVSATFTNTPSALVVRVEYAGVVPADPAAAQVLRLTVPGCGEVHLQRAEKTLGFAGCRTGTFAVGVRAAGNTVTFTLRFETLGGHLRRGVVLTGLRTYTAVAEPVTGYDSGSFMDAFGLGPADSTRGNATYKIG